jgi:hypothetical protein
MPDMPIARCGVHRRNTCDPDADQRFWPATVLETPLMIAMKRFLLAATIVTLPLDAIAPTAEAASTGFDPRIIMFGEAREQIQNTPIEQRPYRPLHVYGNTVRRRQGRSQSTRR